MAGRGCDPGGKNRSGHQSAWTAVRIRESEMPVSSVRIEPVSRGNGNGHGSASVLIDRRGVNYNTDPVYCYPVATRSVCAGGCGRASMWTGLNSGRAMAGSALTEPLFDSSPVVSYC